MENKANRWCLFVIICSGFYVASVGAIDCYVCTSDDTGCGTQVNHYTLLLNQKVQSGCSACTKSFQFLDTIWAKIQRRCGGNGDSCSWVFGHGQCVCSTTFCNGHNQIHASILTVLLVSLIVFCLQNIFAR
ncbi:hypothetical protein ACJMK2_023462 [Sinanodonta woodiana]|uniref:Uncharacterized protein n=1 Tax=Sinanodonta woodiana TaxID=1069815 RepID=A0ABD3T5M4_SINWO